MKKTFSTRLQLTVGLTLLVLSVLLVAVQLGLVPDRESAVREGRLALAESLAMSTAMTLEAAVNDEEAARDIQRLLSFTARRHEALRGAWLHGLRGDVVAAAGAAAEHGRETVVGSLTASNIAGGSSTSHIVVPIVRAGQPWGELELGFAPLSDGFWHSPSVRLVGAVVLGSMLLFYVYLWRMLRHLDPSSVVPKRVRTAFDTLAEGVMVLDAQGRIVLANRALAQVLGIGGDALIGRSASTLAWTNAAQVRIHPDDIAWTASLTDGQARHNVVMALKDAAGRRWVFMVNCSPVPGAAGRPAGVLVSLDDITELEEKELELRIARDDADAANRAKSDFLANMSHEIRTPMNSIIGYTELMRRGSHAPAQTARYLDIVRSSGQHLLALINDILDLSKVEAGRLEVERITCAAHEVVREVVQSMQVKADEKKLWLRLEIPQALPASVQTDPARLRQIVTNLIGNALKFTAEGGVTLTLRVQRGTGQEPAVIAVDVADTGIGIAADKVAAIFEPFVQADASTARMFGGTGLGLAISRRFARSLGGDITVSSVPGQGSTFHVTVEAGEIEGATWLEPATIAALERARAVTADDTLVWRFPPRRVLVVDDAAENRLLVRMVLDGTGLEVHEAEHGARALELAAAVDIDLVLMDVQMPVMDGYTAARELRARGFDRAIVAFSANAMKGFEQQIEAAGFDGWLTKPIDIDLLLADVGARLGGTRVAAPAVDVVSASVRVSASVEAMPVGTDVASAARPQTDVATTDVVRVVSRLASHPRLRRAARSFALQLPSRLESMQEALSRSDHEGLAALAHWLKGAGGTVGYDAFTEPAKALEAHAKAGDAAAARVALEHLRDLLPHIVVPEAEPAQTESA